jgi:hypothetical protein
VASQSHAAVALLFSAVRGEEEQEEDEEEETYFQECELVLC